VEEEFFWDGRAAALREQVLQPIQNPIEMHESLDYLVKKLAMDTNYHRPLCQRVRLTGDYFGSHRPRAGTISPGASLV